MTFDENKLSGYEEYKQFVDEIKPGKIVNLYFTGSKESNGVSWCPDCVLAEPHVRNAFEKHSGNSLFAYIDVGDRTFWKDTKNPFRLDTDIRLMVIPTLLRWKSPQRLEGDQCEKDDLLEMFFTDDD